MVYAANGGFSASWLCIAWLAAVSALRDAAVPAAASSMTPSAQRSTAYIAASMASFMAS